MDIESFVGMVGADFYTGVPDSRLIPLCSYLADVYGTRSKHHIIAANEGNAVAIAAGYYLATGKTPVVYMQNSGEGNAVNPIASLLNEKIYGIPCQFLIGWRGEPGVHDEPQHAFQGEITLRLLEVLHIAYCIVGSSTSERELREAMEGFREMHQQGKQTAFVIRKGALAYGRKASCKNGYTMLREAAIRQIVSYAGNDLIVATTGKTGRELYEVREKQGTTHSHDFLTVGSMGHASSIALGIAAQKPGCRIWCLDGDGALLMHMGSMAVIGQQNPQILIHVVLNNEAHESVGGMPTAASVVDLCKIAEACGYQNIYRAKEEEELADAMNRIKGKAGLSFLEIECAIGSRQDLGRPKTAPAENKAALMAYLREMKNE